MSFPALCAGALSLRSLRGRGLVAVGLLVAVVALSWWHAHRDVIPTPRALVQLLPGSVVGSSCAGGVDGVSSGCFALSLETCSFLWLCPSLSLQYFDFCLSHSVVRTQLVIPQ